MDIIDISILIICVALYFFLKKPGKKISMFIGVVYFSFMACVAFSEDLFLKTIIYSCMGLICVLLIYLVEKGTQSSKNRSKKITGILACCFGGLGAHKFYTGKTAVGSIYLVFLWTGIPIIVGLVEGGILLNESKKEDELNEINNNKTEIKMQQYNQSPAETSLSTIDTPPIHGQETVSQKSIKSERISLPIGICTISGDEEYFEISIISNGKQYKFNVEGDSITEYWKSGMVENKRYGV